MRAALGGWGSWRLAAALSTTLASFALAGCAVQRADAPPLDLAQAQARRVAVSGDSPEVRSALERRHIDVSVWPLPRWDLPALSALALTVHPDMAAARADVAAVAAGRQTLLQRANPALDFGAEHHSAPGERDSPWTIGAAVDVSLTDGLLGQARRRALVASADAHDRHALDDAATVAWRVHRGVRDSHRGLVDALDASAVARALLPLRQEDAALWQTRLTHGAADARDVAAAQWRLRDAEQVVREADVQVRGERLRLAAALGLTPEQAARLPLAVDDPERGERGGRGDREDQAQRPDETDRPPPDRQHLQRLVLLDRLDVHRRLAAYAAAQARLQLEVARQWPEIRLQPGYEWDQGDNRWRLGVALVLPSWDRNAGPIAEARAALRVLSADVDAVQASAIAELAAAEATVDAADDALSAAAASSAAAAEAVSRSARRLANGDADRLETLIARLDAGLAARGVQVARATQRAARDGLEDVLQRPLDTVDGADPTNVTSDDDRADDVVAEAPRR